MLTTFDRYLFRRYLQAVLILFVSTYGLYVVIDGFTNVDAFQQGNPTTAEVLQWVGTYYGFQAIPFFDRVLPFVSAVAIMITFALLRKQNELYPLLAAGIPVYRLTVPVMFGVVLVNVVALVNQEYVMPRFAYDLQADRTEKKRNAAAVEPLYDKARIYIGGKKLSLKQRRLEEAEFILPVPHLVGELTSLKAPEAVYFPAQKDRPSGWLLRNVHPRYDDIPLTEAGRQYVRRTNRPEDLFVLSEVSIDELTNRSKNYQYLSTPQLLARIRHPSTGLISVRGQMLYFHTRLVRPLLGVLALFVVIPLVLRRESRSLVVNMALCAVVLGGLYGIGQFCQYLGYARLLTPDLAAWLPVIISGILAGWLRDVAQS